jgi:hypothetical protein
LKAENKRFAIDNTQLQGRLTEKEREIARLEAHLKEPETKSCRSADATSPDLNPLPKEIFYLFDFNPDDMINVMEREFDLRNSF